MTAKRSYHDSCGAAQALNLVGERWALLVVRELMLGPKRFTDLRAGLPGISPNVLSQRLDELAESGIVTKRRLAPPASTAVYELTQWGSRLEIVLMELGRWAAGNPAFDREAPLGSDSLVMSLRTMFRGESAPGLHAVYGLHIDGDEFVARIDDGTLDVQRGTAQEPDAVITAGPENLAAVLYDPGAPLESALAQGSVQVSGDVAAAERFLELFELPAPCPGTAQPAH